MVAIGTSLLHPSIACGVLEASISAFSKHIFVEGLVMANGTRHGYL
jgi:hypothetical protein